MNDIKQGSIVTWTQSWAHRASEQLTGIVTGVNASEGRVTVHVDGRAGIYTPSLSKLRRAERVVVAQVAQMPVDDSERESAISDLLVVEGI